MVQPNAKWDKLGQVGVVGQVGQGEGGLQILVGQVEQGELKIFVGQVGQGQGVCPLEPFHLPQMGLQDRENVDITTEIHPDTRKFSFGIALSESVLRR